MLPARKLAMGDLPRAGACRLADLHRARVRTAADLWRRLAADDWKIEPLVGEINAHRAGARQPRLEPIDLVEVATALAEKDTKRLSRPPWWGLSQVFVPILIALFFFIAWKLANPPATLRERVAVARADGIPPYHLIGADDVRLVKATPDPLAASSLAAVVGRYSTRAMKQGEPVRSADLADGRLVPDLNRRAILTLPVGGFDGVLAASLPAVVTLLLSDQAGTSHERQEDVYLLALSREPAGATTPAPAVVTATVAVPTGALDALHPLLHARPITVAWEPPR